MDSASTERNPSPDGGSKMDRAFQERVQASQGIVRSLKTKEDEKRTATEKFADWITAALGSMKFLILNLLWFAVWMAINTGLIPGVTPFDPFPFGLLTMIVSLEAIALAIIVLISQNRAAKIADLRGEIDLQVDIITESELTKLMMMMHLLLEKQGIDLSADHDLDEMLKPTNVDKLEEALEQQVVNNTKSDRSHQAR